MKYDAVIVGSGPNGLAAAAALAAAGRSVLVLESKDTIGGGARSAALTLPGFTHDVCSAVHPLGMASPFFKRLPLEKHGLRWIEPPIPLAHPLDGGKAAVLHRSIEETARGLGGADGERWASLFGRWVPHADAIIDEIFRPLRFPRMPFLMAGLGLRAIRSAEGIARSFQGPEARALLAGLAGHSFLPLDRPPSAAIGFVLGIAAHAVGWPIPEGGSQRISDALASYIKSLGGEIRTGAWVKSPADLPEARAVLFDLTPGRLLALAGDRLPAGYRARLGRWRLGPGVFKMDFAVSGPIPWSVDACGRAATVHLGGTMEEIMASEQAASGGQVSPKPYVLLAQPSAFDATRAPTGKHVVWAYCHVPRGSTADQTAAVEGQIERFAPGFRETILKKSVLTPRDMEAHNPNLEGGDISGGIADLGQLFFRMPYVVPVPGWYLCSSATSPGSGVHGMCGYWAAQAALARGL